MKASDGGIYYEINSEHPLVKSIIEECPEIKNKLNTLLKQIGLSIPLNSLYIDLTNDEKLKNDTDAAEKDVLDLLRSILTTFQTADDKYAMIETLKLSEPFCSYQDEIDLAKKKGYFDD